MTRFRPADPPALDDLPLIHAATTIEQWLSHYWHKLKLPVEQLDYLAMTCDRGEFARWTGRRLHPMILGCYCYLPVSAEHEGQAPDMLMAREQPTSYAARAAGTLESLQLALPGFGEPQTRDAVAVAVLDPPTAAVGESYRHLIFIEPGLLPLGVEVTVAHELIHLADRVNGTPRKHRCHGHDAISMDEAAITGRDPEELRALLREETIRREAALRQVRPYRYLYVCLSCGREYRRVRQYGRVVSCGSCDHHYNAIFELRLRALLTSDGSIERLVEPGEEDE